jgi:hypothetical protein
MSITNPTKSGDERKNACAHVGLVVPASINTTGVTRGAGTAHPSGAPEFISGF